MCVCAHMRVNNSELLRYRSMSVFQLCDCNHLSCVVCYEVKAIFYMPVNLTIDIIQTSLVQACLIQTCLIQTCLRQACLIQACNRQVMCQVGVRLATP